MQRMYRDEKGRFCKQPPLKGDWIDRAITRMEAETYYRHAFVKKSLWQKFKARVKEFIYG